MTWVETVLESRKGSESPRDYYYWAALAAISAVVANRVYLDKFYYKLWPNVYVILVGRSGMRKGPPIALAQRLVEAVDVTRVIHGRASIEAIINELATAQTRANGGPPIMDGRGFLVSSEFASFIIQNDSALTNLTDLYDSVYHNTWPYRTKGGGIQIVKKPYLTLLGASNEVHFKESVPMNAIGGGFVARTFIIHADKKFGSNPLTERPVSLIPDTDLLDHLKKVSELEGQFIWTREGKMLYDRWYAEFDAAEIEDETGTIDRFSDSVLKTAMLISLSRDLSLELKEVDIQEAIVKCSAFIPGAVKVTLGAQGRSVSREGTAVVLRYLMQIPGHAAPKTKLLQKFWGHFNADELKVIIDSLVIAKAVRLEQRQTASGRGLGAIEDWVVLEPRIIENMSNLNMGRS